MSGTNSIKFFLRFGNRNKTKLRIFVFASRRRSANINAPLEEKSMFTDSLPEMRKSVPRR